MQGFITLFLLDAGFPYQFIYSAVSSSFLHIFTSNKNLNYRMYSVFQIILKIFNTTLQNLIWSKNSNIQIK